MPIITSDARRHPPAHEPNKVEIRKSIRCPIRWRQASQPSLRNVLKSTEL